MPAAVSSTARASLVTRPDGATLVLEGDWHLGEEPAGSAEALAGLDAVPAGAVVVLDAQAVGGWDSALIAYLMQVVDRAQGRAVQVDRRALPAGIGKLLDLALAVPEKRDARRADVTPPFLERVGRTAQQLSGEIGGLIGFLGEVTLALGRFVTGRARFRRSDLGVALEQVGIDALGVVAIINFLVGLILAFVGAAQLEQFGAAIFVANLVGIAMVRDMAAIMTGIVMAGRSGAAFAASLGTMQSNQEIDALRTTGVSPIDYLVLPRIVALVLMMPLLTLFADAVGVLGGAFVATAMLDLSWTRYFQQTWEAVSLGHLLGGLFKGTVYGALIAVAGCWRGMLSGRTAAAVGLATTSAVVTSILLIIGAAGLFAVVFYVLGL
jgi:phospholipid/cholesterol/gamma-HCH transport system permease protein